MTCFSKGPENLSIHVPLKTMDWGLGPAPDIIDIMNECGSHLPNFRERFAKVSKAKNDVLCLFLRTL